MFNPLVDDLADLNDAELDDKIRELSRKYMIATNPEVANQIATILNMYKEESIVRTAKAQQKMQEDGNNSLDNLINID